MICMIAHLIFLAFICDCDNVRCQFNTTGETDPAESPTETPQTITSPYSAIIVGTVLLAISVLFYVALFKTEWRKKLFWRCAAPEFVPDDRGRQFYQMGPYELEALVQNPISPTAFIQF